jgi:hypothetical protein
MLFWLKVKVNINALNAVRCLPNGRVSARIAAVGILWWSRLLATLRLPNTAASQRWLRKAAV